MIDLILKKLEFPVKNSTALYFIGIICGYEIQKTIEFLAICLRYKIKLVAIKTNTKLIPESLSWDNCNSSVFSSVKEENSRWPAIWGVAKKANVYNGCGNTGQAHIKPELLISGVFRFSKGKWRKIEC